MAVGSLAISKTKRFRQLCYLASYKISISTTASYLMKNKGGKADFS